MGASAKLFLANSEQLATVYDATFTKKEAIETGNNIITDIIEKGNVDKIDVLTNVTRLMEVFGTVQSALKKDLPIEKFSKNGMEFNYVQGGDIPQFEEDPIYAELKKELKEREDLLKLALKQDGLIDKYGNDVPKVSTKPKASYHTIKY
jgi:hypothetical protein